jgi:hypothetical protein
VASTVCSTTGEKEVTIDSFWWQFSCFSRLDELNKCFRGFHMAKLKKGGERVNTAWDTLNAIAKKIR